MDKKQFMIEYFKKLLDNDLTVFTESWIDRNYERLDKIEKKTYPITPIILWSEYKKYFQDKYKLGMWHEVMPYDDIYNIYIDVGFSEKEANRCAKNVRQLMDEYEQGKDVLGWGHQPNIFYWTPHMLVCKKRKDTYNIKDYH